MYAHYDLQIMSDEQANSFSWDPLGEQWWRAAAQSCTHKPSETQLRFAVGRHDGLTAVDAARRAGYSGGGEQIRGAGSRALKSTSVQELLAYAFAETGTGDDGVIKGPEARRILSRIGRTGDNSARIKALELLSKLDREEQANRSEERPDYDAAIRWWKAFLKFAFDEVRAGIGFEDFCRRASAHAIEQTKTVPSSRGNGARAPETAEEGSDAAAA